MTSSTPLIRTKQSVFTEDGTYQDHIQGPSPYRDIGHLHIHRPEVEK